VRLNAFGMVYPRVKFGDIWSSAHKIYVYRN